VGEVPFRNPITGIAGCCARARSGHAATGHAAAPPSSVMNARRFNCSKGINRPPARPKMQGIALDGIGQRVISALARGGAGGGGRVGPFAGSPRAISLRVRDTLTL
jgi:hypothetical protein